MTHILSMMVFHLQCDVILGKYVCTNCGFVRLAVYIIASPLVVPKDRAVLGGTRRVTPLNAAEEMFGLHNSRVAHFTDAVGFRHVC